MNAHWRQGLEVERPIRRFRFLGMMVDEFIFPASRFGGPDGAGIVMWVRAGCLGHPFIQVGRQVLCCPVVQMQFPLSFKFGLALSQAMLSRAFAHHYGLFIERIVHTVPQGLLVEQ